MGFASPLFAAEPQAAHETYQTAPRHLKFVKLCSPLGDQVAVFDSYGKPQ